MLGVGGAGPSGGVFASGRGLVLGCGAGEEALRPRGEERDEHKRLHD